MSCNMNHGVCTWTSGCCRCPPRSWRCLSGRTSCAAWAGRARLFWGCTRACRPGRPAWTGERTAWWPLCSRWSCGGGGDDGRSELAAVYTYVVSAMRHAAHCTCMTVACGAMTSLSRDASKAKPQKRLYKLMVGASQDAAEWLKDTTRRASHFWVVVVNIVY